jgi:hypothetical protein
MHYFFTLLHYQASTCFGLILQPIIRRPSVLCGNGTCFTSNLSRTSAGLDKKKPMGMKEVEAWKCNKVKK